MELDLNELKRMAEEVRGWSNVSDAWANPDDEDQGVQMPTWIVGTIGDDDVHYDVAVVDCEQYSVPGESEKLAKFYASANPSVVLDLVRRLRDAEARVAELESERAEREAGKLLAYLSNDRTQFFIPSMEGKYVKHAPYMAHWMAGWTPLYAATPVTAQVRLNDSEMEMIARAHGTGGWQTLDDMVRFARAIEAASLRAKGLTAKTTDCAGAQHERQEAPAIGLRDCNSKNHGGQAATPQCGYLMRTTDPGCTGCVERDEDQRAEAGG